ncbi:MAG: hypothetical protein ACW99Q_19360 [Candidatus Kariarchaeaceae archaeon]|jgi:hypothetical protein
MRYLILALITIVLISGCIEFPESQQATLGFVEKTDNPDVYLSSQSTPTEVKGGRNITLIFNITNKQGFDIENVSLSVYDQCIFTGESEWSSDKLRVNRTQLWNWKWSSPKVELEKDCEVKLRTEYDSQYNLTQDIIVLAETEYYIREQTGNLSDLQPSLSSSLSPLKISLRFSDTQPFLENENITMFIDYENIGDGFIEIDNITMIVPKNLQGICNHYTNSGVISPEYEIGVSGNEFVLNRELTFFNNKATESTCTFTTNATQIIDQQILSITAHYKYMFDNSMIIKVEPK